MIKNEKKKWGRNKTGFDLIFEKKKWKKIERKAKEKNGL